MSHVAVIGGGFAGLSAAVALAARGHRVTVLEARAHLGGRAHSFRDAATGSTVDNGQHAMMGCYTRTLGFLDRIGSGGSVTRQRDLLVPMRDAARGAGEIRGAALPAPLHLLGGLLRYRLLTRGERLSALVAGLRIMRLRARRDPRLAESTIDGLLVGLGQSPNARRSFWHPVAVATCNEAPERAAAAPFAEVVARAFFGSRSDSQFVFSRVGLSELYTDGARRFVESRGGAVELRAPAGAIEFDRERLARIRLRDGRNVEADACVAAVPPRALLPLLPAALAEGSDLRRIGEFGPSPIVSTHLWFDRPVLGEDFVGMIGSTTQWAFDRDRLGIDDGNGRGAVSAVVSAAHGIVDLEPAEIAARAVDEIRAAVPGARPAALLRSLVVKEREATVSVTPSAERLRPKSWTPIPNLALAGDWIATGLPPTIESAVVSGEQAAELIRSELEVPR